MEDNVCVCVCHVCVAFAVRLPADRRTPAELSAGRRLSAGSRLGARLSADRRMPGEGACMPASVVFVCCVCMCVVSSAISCHLAEQPPEALERLESLQLAHRSDKVLLDLCLAHRG